MKNKALDDETFNHMFSDFGLKPFDLQEIEYVRNQAKQAYGQYESFVRQLNTMLATNKHLKTIDAEQSIPNQLTIEDYETTQQPKGF